MGFRRVALALAASMSLAILVTLSLGQDDPGVHAGQVLVYKTGRPIVAQIKAWDGDQQTGNEGDCPMYGNPLDARVSASDGTFALRITEAHIYTVVYCASGYFTQVTPDLVNELGLDVVPRPTTMWPSGDLGEDYDQAVKSAALSALGTLAYLRSINGDRFDAAIATVSEQIAKVDPERAKTYGQLQFFARSWQVSQK